MTASKRYFLLKSEPSVYSIDALERDKTSDWEGVRNYQARNIMRDEMRVGDLAFFYHSNAKPPALAGIATISAIGKVDPSQFDPQSAYFDPKSKEQEPTWQMVQISFVEKFKSPIALETLRRIEALDGLALLAKGQRLSIQRVSPEHWKTICELAKKGD